MLINMKEMLAVANKNHFAVGAFNATESSLFRSVVEEAEARMPLPLCRWRRGNLSLPPRNSIHM